MIPIKLDEIIFQITSPFLVSCEKSSDNIYDLVLQGKKRIWNVRLTFLPDFPFHLPTVILLDTSIIGSIPHINYDGIVCVEESDSVLLDYHRPDEIIIYYIEQIVELLDRASLKIYRDELTDEYEGYFHPEATYIHSFYSATSVAESVYLQVLFPKKKEFHCAEPFLLYDKNDAPPWHYSNLNDTRKNQLINIIHLPLEQAVLPPENNKPISSEYLFNLKHLISEKNKKKVKKLLAKEKDARQFFTLISMPRTNGERTQILLSYNAKEASLHPLAKLSTHWKIKLYLLNRNNSSYLLERGGAENKLAEKKVTIIGCGSVGGEIAAMIAKAGVGELTLIDHDSLKPDNIYRHRLGGSAINYKNDKPFYKVSVLANQLAKDLPYLKINIKPLPFGSTLQDKDLQQSDVIISAVGSPTLNLEINRTLKNMALNHIIFCWNEADGIGGHSVALDLTKSCYECLYSDEKGFSMNCNLNLLESEQNISKNLTGCVGVFTPFSYIDSSQTAALAAKQCIDMLLLNIHSKAISWKGDNHNQLKVSQRYHDMALKEEQILSTQDACIICHG